MYRRQLKDLIEQKNISVSKLARMVDCHEQTIGNYLNEKSDMSVSTYEKIMETLENLK